MLLVHIFFRRWTASPLSLFETTTGTENAPIRRSKAAVRRGPHKLTRRLFHHVGKPAAGVSFITAAAKLHAKLSSILRPTNNEIYVTVSEPDCCMIHNHLESIIFRSHRVIDQKRVENDFDRCLCIFVRFTVLNKWSVGVRKR